MALAFGSRTVDHPDGPLETRPGQCFAELRIVAEPGGAAALAALLSGAYRPQDGERVGVLMCGGNTDPSVLAAGNGASVDRR